MNSHFAEQQTRERIGDMMREAAQHRLANEGKSPKPTRILPLLQSGRPAVQRLVHFLNPMHRTPLTTDDRRPAR